MRRERDLSYLENIPIIRDFLEENTILPYNKIRRYLLDLSVIYPYIINEYKTFEAFLELNMNKKASFFLRFVENEINERLKLDKQKDYNLIKGRVLQVMWQTQGFLAHLSPDLRANPKLLENQSTTPSLESKIKIGDVLDLYEILPDIGRRRLKLQLYAGYNNIDLVELRLDDFKSAGENNFLYIRKSREKTKGKKVIFMNIFHTKTFDEYQRFCNRYDIKSNQLMFPVTPNAIYKMYKSYLLGKLKSMKKNPPDLNGYTTAKHIRSLNATLLRPIFKETDMDLFHLWTQHNLRLVDKYYIKDQIDRMIAFYPLIAERVLLGDLKEMTIELQELKQDLALDVKMTSEKVKELEQKYDSLQQKKEQHTEIKDLIEETIIKTLKEIKK